jgi:CubicO group peptidase (beta-lactamase class C family)
MSLVTELTARRLTASLAAEQRAGRVPSLAAALTRDGTLAWRGGYGSATGVPGVGPVDLQFRIGSITKTMTAVLVLQLRDEGLLRLADPLSAYLPEVAHGEVSLRSLLAHTSGLAAEPPGEWWERVEGGGFAAVAAALADAERPFEQGATHHYSNLAYALLGEVVARVGGSSWWERLSDRLLAPLGMLRTSYDPFHPHATGYSVAPYAPLLTAEPAADTGAMAPAGQVWSTVLDLATYADFLVTGHPDVLRRESLDEMATPQGGAVADGLASGYGLGLRLLPGGSGTLVGHTGSMPGFQAALFVDRERRTGAVVLANATAGLRGELLATGLLELLEECEPTVVDAWEPADSVPREVGELLGIWYWGNTPLVLSWDGRTLWSAQAFTGHRPAGFRPGPDGLVGTSGYHHGEPLEVVRGPGGEVAHLRVSTFVLTRVPYDPAAPIPGGAPVSGPG